MSPHPSRRTVMAGAAVLAGRSHAVAANTQSEGMQGVLDFVHDQKTTGFLVMQNRKTVVEKNWPAPPSDTRSTDKSIPT